MEDSRARLAEYVRKAQAGDPDAFTYIFANTNAMIMRYCRQYLKDEALAEDALQETFLSAFRKINDIKDPMLFIAWLKQIAFHVCYDITSKYLSKQNELTDEVILESVMDSNESANPEDSFFSEDEKKRLGEALEKFPPKEREVIVLRYYRDLKIDEIAVATNLSRSTVKRQLKSGTGRLKKLMQE